jgi:hypothetical protein
MDGDTWTVVDEQKNNSQLIDVSATVGFDIDEARHTKCRFVRLRQEGGRTHPREGIWLSGFEVFGDFVETGGG